MAEDPLTYKGVTHVKKWWKSL